MPFTIPVTATDFGAPFQPHPDGDLTPQFRNRDLVRAAFMAGHPNDVGNAPDPRIRAWRIATIKLAVQHAARNHLRHPRAWQRLDPTEKGQIRNLLGNTITKLLCERLLQAPLMVFLDVYGAAHRFVYRGKRPDYIAQTLGGAWFTVEAKGRDRMANLAKLMRVKQLQAQAPPVAAPGQLHAHVVSWIGQRWGNVHAAIHDPEPFDELRLPALTSKALAEVYYAPALRILRSNPEWLDQPGEQLVPIEGTDCTLGMHPKVAWLLRDNQGEHVSEFLGYLNSSDSAPSSMNDEGYGPDGIRLVLGDSWPKETGD